MSTTSDRSKPVEPGSRWAIVLAAGEGRRLSGLTGNGDGSTVPKQFCSVAGGPTLLQETVLRAARMVSLQRVVTLVAAQHRSWWSDDLAAHATDNVVVQPANRGTAAGILLPLLRVVERDAGAEVVILPSDHFVESEVVLATAVRSAFSALRSESTVTLLGFTPTEADPQLGWIVPGRQRLTRVSSVDRFVEKPAPDLAERLMAAGALWNGFILVARATALLQLYRQTLPTLLETLARATSWDKHHAGAGAVDDAYQGLPTQDFSRDVLQSQARALRVLRVPPCGWSDLGTPERLARCAERLGGERQRGRVVRLPRLTQPALRPVLAAAV